jgi:hypothetical protein
LCFVFFLVLLSRLRGINHCLKRHGWGRGRKGETHTDTHIQTQTGAASWHSSLSRGKKRGSGRFLMKRLLRYNLLSHPKIDSLFLTHTHIHTRTKKTYICTLDPHACTNIYKHTHTQWNGKKCYSWLYPVPVNKIHRLSVLSFSLSSSVVVVVVIVIAALTAKLLSYAMIYFSKKKGKKRRDTHSHTEKTTHQPIKNSRLSVSLSLSLSQSLFRSLQLSSCSFSLSLLPFKITHTHTHF